ncbi:hypothetical protein [Marivirga sp.]|uniref:hypothetical protein n=1 Tax=Marivirga sp. TaxID=2018662 RepID=UPI002D7F84CA|nr:hypothetical protein [Marivirga sp.]HET8858755.1 hypothetical protein [Marivirga sp.]
MNILFRVDAGGEVGLGHYYRSVALANKLSEKGHKILFAHNPSDFWDLEKSKGFTFQTFELNSLKQINELLIIKQYLIDLFYVDGIIEFDKEFISQIKKYAKIAFYQNISNSKYLADLFILPSINQKKPFFSDFKPSTRVYQGLEYFTFHNKVTSLKKKESINEVKNIGIIAGGTDPKNTLKIIQGMLDKKDYKNISFNFFYGNDYKYLIDLKKYNTKYTNFLYNEFNHQDILKNDLLISAFGVSTYEFMALGMPILSYGHQKANAEAVQYLAKNTDALISLGLIDDLTETKLNSELNELINNPNKRKKLSKLAKSTLDFKGVDRIVKILENG